MRIKLKKRYKCWRYYWIMFQSRWRKITLYDDMVNVNCISTYPLPNFHFHNMLSDLLDDVFVLTTVTIFSRLYFLMHYWPNITKMQSHSSGVSLPRNSLVKWHLHEHIYAIWIWFCWVLSSLNPQGNPYCLLFSKNLLLNLSI